MQEAADHVTLRKTLPIRLPQCAVHLAALQIPVRIAVRVVPHLKFRERS